MTAPHDARVQELGRALLSHLRIGPFQSQDTATAIAKFVRDEMTAEQESVKPVTKNEVDALALVAKTLDEVCPGWLIMTDAIRSLAARGQSGQKDVPTETTPTRVDMIRANRWLRVVSVLHDVTPGWVRPASESMETGEDAERAIRHLAAQQRESAEMVAKLTQQLEHAVGQTKFWVGACADASKRAETAEAALRERDGQQPELYMNVYGSDACTMWRTAEGAKGLAHRAAATEVAVPLYRHPAPAARVVGACVVDADDKVAAEWTPYANVTLDDCITAAVKCATETNRRAFKMIVGPALPAATEGGR